MKIFGGCVLRGGLGLLCLFLGACSVIPRLNVSYVTPAGADAPVREEIGLRVEDARNDGNIFGSAAASRLGGNIQMVSLSVGPSLEQSTPEGIFDVPGLMREAFKRKLTAAGFNPETTGANDSPVVVIVVKEFFLDLVKHNWTGRIAYDAKLLVDGRVKVTRSIEGSAKRLNALGRADADTLVGELFTDCVNRLDLHGLFEVAGMALP